MTPVHADILLHVRRRMALSKAVLARELGARPNTVGSAVDRLVATRWLRVAESHSSDGRGRGRPEVRYELDPASLRLGAVVLRPEGAILALTDLRGQPVGTAWSSGRVARGRLLSVAASRLRTMSGRAMVGVGVAAPGMVDTAQRRLLVNAGVAPRDGLDLAPLFDASRGRPLAVDNDVQARAERWRLAHAEADGEDVLFVYLDDGAIGAALLPHGPSSSGVVRSANELGHTQVGEPTGACYCSQNACLERAFSTEFLRRQGGRRTLADAVARLPHIPPPLAQALGRLDVAVLNAVNLLRPHRVVVAGPLAGDALIARLRLTVRRRCLPLMRERVAVSHAEVDADNPLAAAASVGFSAVLGRHTATLTPPAPSAGFDERKVA